MADYFNKTDHFPVRVSERIAYGYIDPRALWATTIPAKESIRIGREVVVMPILGAHMFPFEAEMRGYCMKLWHLIHKDGIA